MRRRGPWVIALLLAAAGGVLAWWRVGHPPLRTQASFRAALGVGPEFPIVWRTGDCRAVPFETFARELRRVAGHGDRIMAPSGAEATITVAREGARRCPEPYAIAAFMPALDTTDLDGRPVSAQGLRGRVTVMSFFWEECPSCIREVVHLNALTRRHADLNWLSLTFEPAEVARGFARAHGLSLPVVAGGQRFIDEAGVRVYPSLMAWGADGAYLGTHGGWPLEEAGQAEAVAAVETWLARVIAENRHRERPD